MMPPELEARAGGTHRGEQVSAAFAIGLDAYVDQMRDEFRIRVGVDLAAGSFEFST